MATYHSDVHISTGDAALIRRYMDVEPTSRDEAFVDNTLVYTARFDNGYEVDVKCCGVSCFDDEPDAVNTAWGEAVLFDNDGCEVAYEMAEGSAGLFDDWTLRDRQGNEYVTHVIVAEEG